MNWKLWVPATVSIAVSISAIDSAMNLNTISLRTTTRVVAENDKYATLLKTRSLEYVRDSEAGKMTSSLCADFKGLMQQRIHDNKREFDSAVRHEVRLGGISKAEGDTKLQVIQDRMDEVVANYHHVARLCERKYG